ncbi:uncharacterized protein LOC127244800 isoform X2 [Andrographis paniculata]|uniref:uncharacterized protein LOC127244800 isoform X2 n=1 Tax=Andrographis paniculata TaxID=175694 RepID=UPI0021E75724|nr:uncharacterized protein LOC127244800 isoform X2 [Andrographis paniculata]
MVNSEERKPAVGEWIGDVDPLDQIIDEEDMVDVSSSVDKASVSANQSVTRRLAELFVEDGDGDLLLQRSDREDGVHKWLRALNLQVMGACRADERLKPLLKLNTSTDAAEDPLLAHLSQHFEPAEVGMLARCLCIPLVSTRVGKINKQGTLLFPTSVRGNLCVTLLPSSDLRISFNGDDGFIERLATLSTEAQCNEIEIEEILADKSGRSFFIKASDGLVSYFWCSEKSKLLGTELLRKMKALLIKKPSLAELTGICDSRLNCFATHFRAYLAGSMHATSAHVGLSDDQHDSAGIISSSSSICQKIAHFQQANLTYEDSSILLSNGTTAHHHHPLAVLSFLEKSSSATELPHAAGQAMQFPPPPISPQYCWCPPVTPTLEIPQLSLAAAPPSYEPPSLPPPLSVYLASKKPLLNLADGIPPIDFPPELPSLLCTSQQQIPTFTPLVCDPIIHVPVIDVCSSGQGYLVSGGPATAMSTVIPPVNVDRPSSSAESMVEKSARETLRMLISSSMSNPVVAFPSLLSSDNTGSSSSRALYSGGTQDVVDPMEFLLGGIQQENYLFNQNVNRHQPKWNTDSSSTPDEMNSNSNNDS